MDREEIVAVVAAMAPIAGELADGTRLVTDLGYDSVRLIELSIALEVKFSLPPAEELPTVGVTTVADVVRMVREATA